MAVKWINDVITRRAEKTGRRERLFENGRFFSIFSFKLTSSLIILCYTSQMEENGKFFTTVKKQNQRITVSFSSIPLYNAPNPHHQNLTPNSIPDSSFFLSDWAKMCSEQESMIEKLQIFKIQGRDKRGRVVLRIVGKFFPVRYVSVEAVNKYLEQKIFPKLEKRPFSILYINTGVQKPENSPGVSFLRSIYDAIPAAVKNNLEAVYFLHPGLQARLFLATFGRLLFGGRFYGKVKFVSRVGCLWDHVRRNEVDVPDFVYEHDEDLEYRPMMDYGLESDHPRVYGAPSVDSSVTAYSMRCIS